MQALIADVKVFETGEFRFAVLEHDDCRRVCAAQEFVKPGAGGFVKNQNDIRFIDVRNQSELAIGFVKACEMMFCGKVIFKNR